MAKRYKGYKKLNRMIDELENTVIAYDKELDITISPNVVTRKAPAQAFQDIINVSTGKFYSYQEAKAVASQWGDKDFTYKKYLNRIHEFQDLGYFEQLTLEGEMQYNIERGIKVFGKDAFDIIIDEVGYSNYRIIIDRIGRLSNHLKKENSNYDSNTFYDMFEIYVENVNNGVNPLDALNIVEDMFS